MSMDQDGRVIRRGQPGFGGPGPVIDQLQGPQFHGPPGDFEDNRPYRSDGSRRYTGNKGDKHPDDKGSGALKLFPGGKKLRETWVDRDRRRFAGQMKNDLDGMKDSRDAMRNGRGGMDYDVGGGRLNR